MLGMGSGFPDRAEPSANLGEEGEPHNSRKQGHQPVLRGSGGVGKGQRYGAAEPWGQGALNLLGFGGAEDSQGRMVNCRGSIHIVTPQGRNSCKEGDRGIDTER